MTPSPENAENRRAEFDARLEPNFPRVYNYLRRLVRSPELAEDLAQEAFLKAWAAFDRFDREKPFLPWVLQIARRLALDAWRRQHEVAWPEGLDPRAPEPADPERQAQNQERAAQLERALEQLPEKQRSAVFLYYIEGLPPETLARVLGTSTGAVNALLFRARQALKRLLSES